MTEGETEAWSRGETRGPFEGRRKYNPAVILSAAGSGLPIKNCKKEHNEWMWPNPHISVLAPGCIFLFFVCTQSNWGLDLWPLTCEVLRRMMCDLLDFHVMRTTSCALMAINDNHGKIFFIAFQHLPLARRRSLTLETARITENEITLAYTRLVLLLTLAGCFFCLPQKPRNTDLHSYWDTIKGLKR